MPANTFWFVRAATYGLLVSSAVQGHQQVIMCSCTGALLGNNACKSLHNTEVRWDLQASAAAAAPLGPFLFPRAAAATNAHATAPH